MMELGNIEPFNKYEDRLDCLVDGSKNTALHIYSRTGGAEAEVEETDTRFLCFPKMRSNQELFSNFVEQLVDKCPSLLFQPNDKGEIPLHIAVQHGHDEIVKILIDRAKVMPLRHENLEKGRTSSEATGSWLRKMLRMKDNLGNTVFHKAVESGDVDVVRLLVKESDPDFSYC